MVSRGWQWIPKLLKIIVREDINKFKFNDTEEDTESNINGHCF